LPPLALGLYALRIDADLDFAAASEFERVMLDHLSANPDLKQVCLFAQPINRIDATGWKPSARSAGSSALAASRCT
jgi:SulP family sulfate permease